MHAGRDRRTDPCCRDAVDTIVALTSGPVSICSTPAFRGLMSHGTLIATVAYGGRSTGMASFHSAAAG